MALTMNHSIHTSPLTPPLSTCAASENHAEDAAALAAEMLDPQRAEQVAELFKALADPTRIRLISLLARREVCVGDLCIALGMSQPAVSYQLRLLRSLHIVRARKEGKHVYYTLDDDHVYQLYDQGLHHVAHG